MYKILHLTTGEDITISTQFCRSIITEDQCAWENQYGLCIPGYRPRYPSERYKTALFDSEKAAKSWLLDLLKRGTVKDLNLRLEHFDILEIE